MRITGGGTNVKLFDDSGKEIIGIARLVINFPNRQLILTPTSTLRESIHGKQIPFVAEVYETQKNGKGYVAMRDAETGKFKINEIKGNADVVIDKR